MVLKLLLLLGPNTQHLKGRGGSWGKKHLISAVLHEYSAVFQQERNKKARTRRIKHTQVAPHGRQDTEEALTPHRNLRRQQPCKRAQPQVLLRSRGQEGSQSKCPNILFFTSYINHVFMEHLQIILFLISVVRYTCSSIPPGLLKGPFPPKARNTPSPPRPSDQP